MFFKVLLGFSPMPSQLSFRFMCSLAFSDVYPFDQQRPSFHVHDQYPKSNFWRQRRRTRSMVLFLDGQLVRYLALCLIILSPTLTGTHISASIRYSALDVGAIIVGQISPHE